ncbi:hypothetical protein SO802_031233 [Lithocarpus litseifolius]|uniref:Uncharacterized protein n=1 Tax=Lithocarpus litseifolius TaxID=425828 RepID=A0AAW2BMB5_9ROSI
MADYEDYKNESFPDFDEFTHQFEEEDEKGKGKSDPNIHQKTKAKSDPNIDCIPHSLSSNIYSFPQPPTSTLAPISPFALELNDPFKFCQGRKWIPETELCERERNKFSLNGQSLLERYNEIKGTNFEFVRLVKIQLMPSSGIMYFIQFEAKPSTEQTLKTRAVDLETDEYDRQEILKMVNEVLEKIKALTESHKAISKKVKALAESKRAMNEELSRLQEILENITEDELQSLDSTDQESTIHELIVVGVRFNTTTLRYAPISWAVINCFETIRVINGQDALAYWIPQVAMRPRFEQPKP